MNEKPGWVWMAGIVLVGIVAFALWGRAGGGPVPPPAGGPTAAGGGRPPEGAVAISIASSITKREWLEEAVKLFNAASKSDTSLQVNRKPIFVEVVMEEDALQPGTLKHYRSPTQVKDTLAGKIKPTVLSPADEAWALWLNKEWRATHGGRDIITSKPQSVAQTPVVIAMWQSRASALDCWPVAGPGCTWERLRALAGSPTGWGMLGHPEWGTLKFGYAYVGESDVGTQTAVLLCMSGLKKTAGLTVGEIGSPSGCGQAITDVEKAKVRSGTSSPWLLEGMVKSGLDAATTYEKEVIAFNRDSGPSLREPLVAAYPQDGTVVARHPFAILEGADWVSPEQAQAARVFQTFLLSSEQQRKLIDTGMRPADPSVKLDSPIDPVNGANPSANVATVEVPETLVLDRIQEVWRQVKKSSMLAIVFDKSGSMAGEKITAASRGATEFVDRMEGNDWLVWIPFDDNVYTKTQGWQGEVGERLVGDIKATPAGGGTALYDAVARAYRVLEEQRRVRGKDAGRYGIVVLSDGRDTSSKETSLALLESMLRPSEQDPTGIQIHTIGIGQDADDAVLTKIASSAHGKYWKAKTTTVTEVVNIYLEIAKYY